MLLPTVEEMKQVIGVVEKVLKLRGEGELRTTVPNIRQVRSYARSFSFPNLIDLAVDRYTTLPSLLL
jgi:hypothetical protein